MKTFQPKQKILNMKSIFNKGLIILFIFMLLSFFIGYYILIFNPFDNFMLYFLIISIGFSTFLIGGSLLLLLVDIFGEEISQNEIWSRRIGGSITIILVYVFYYFLDSVVESTDDLIFLFGFRLLIVGILFLGVIPIIGSFIIKKRLKNLAEFTIKVK